MKKKESKRLYIIAVVLALLIISGVLGVSYIMPQEVPKLSPVAVSAEYNTKESEYEEKDVLQEFEGFTIGTAKEQQGSAESSVENNSEYICSFASERLLTESDMETILSECGEIMPEGKTIPQMIINEMYAKYGYQFSNENIQAYFDARQWYQQIQNRNSEMEEIYNQMTETEKKNIDFLQKYEE